MKLNPLVIRRFDELLEKANTILETKTHAFTSDAGKAYFHIDDPAYKQWLTSALNLLQRVFGEDSIHFKQLSAAVAGVKRFDTSFSSTIGVFKAAQEDYTGGYLFNVQSLIRAEVLDDVLEQATALTQRRIQRSGMCTCWRCTRKLPMRTLQSKRHWTRENGQDECRPVQSRPLQQGHAKANHRVG